MKILGKILLGISFIMVLTASRCSSAAKLTKKIEVGVNKATQASKKLGNKAAASAAENPNVQRGAAISGSRMLKNTTQSNAQTTSQPRMLTCPRCYGRGNVQGNDGYVYSCSRCNGTGKIFTR